MTKMPIKSIRIESGDEPLLSRIPTRDEFGKPLSDLMLLFPGLRDKSSYSINGVINELSAVLDNFSDSVVFAELNVRRNLMWISVRPIRGIRETIATHIREKVPEAKLVSHL